MESSYAEALHDILYLLDEHPSEQDEDFLVLVSQTAARLKGLADTEILHRALIWGEYNA